MDLNNTMKGSNKSGRRPNKRQLQGQAPLHWLRCQLVQLLQRLLHQVSEPSNCCHKEAIFHDRLCSNAANRSLRQGFPAWKRQGTFLLEYHGHHLMDKQTRSKEIYLALMNWVFRSQIKPWKTPNHESDVNPTTEWLHGKHRRGGATGTTGCPGGCLVRIF